jgi:hypothetical protein
VSLKKFAAIMNRIEVEAIVHQIIGDLQGGRPVEDDRVELKSEWPTDFQKTARRVAGHANSAGQEPIIWIIGVDEKGRSVVGVTTEQDPATWSESLRSAFAEGWAPSVAWHNVPRDDKIVVALVFSTEGAPYLVKLRDDVYEVPWRSATRIRSAKRQEIFSILSVPTLFPDFEILDAELIAQANRQVPPDKIVAYTFKVTLRVYVTPRSERPVFFPLHRTRLLVLYEGQEEEIDIGSARATADDDDPYVTADYKQVAFKGPGIVTVTGSAQLPVTSYPNTTPMLRLLLSPAGATRSVELRAWLTVEKKSFPEYRRWTFGV